MSPTPGERTALKVLLDMATPGPWYAQPDDLIGGWCVMTIDKTPATVTREEQAAGAREVAAFVSREDAVLVVALHNIGRASYG